MEIISMLWQLGVLAAVLVFGVKVGLASGLANLSKKLFAVVCIAYGGGVLLISYIAEPFSQQITHIIYTYNSLFFIIMAIIMITAGIFTIREWKVHEKNTSVATSIAVIAPCPCCFGTIIASVFIVAPTVGIGLMHLSEIVAVALVAVIVITYFASNIIVKHTSKPYPIILGNFMLFLGCYFLLSAIVIPAIASVLQSNNITGVSAGSTQSIITILVILVALIVIGIILKRRNKNILD
jgi:predicted transporter